MSVVLFEAFCQYCAELKDSLLTITRNFSITAVISGCRVQSVSKAVIVDGTQAIPKHTCIMHRLSHR